MRDHCEDVSAKFENVFHCLPPPTRHVSNGCALTYASNPSYFHTCRLDGMKQLLSTGKKCGGKEVLMLGRVSFALPLLFSLSSGYIEYF